MFFVSGHSLITPLMPNIETMPIWACFRCSAASLPHPSCRTRKACPWGRVSRVQCHPSCRTSKPRPSGHVFDVRLLLYPTLHAGHKKHALAGMFFVFSVFSTLPLTSNTKIVPKWAHFSCTVSCSALPLLLNTDPPLISSVDARFRVWNGFCSPPRAPPIYWPHRPRWWSADHHKPCPSISPTTLEIEHSR